MKYIKIVLQILLLCAVSLAGNMVADYLKIGIPGSIFGILILLVMFDRKWISLDKIELGANVLIAELLLFFIPSAIGVIQFQDVLQKDWTQLLLVIEVSIVFVILFVGFATEWVVGRRGERKGA